MPLNVRRFCMSIFLVLFGLSAFSFSQTPAATPAPTLATPATTVPQANVPPAPTSGDVMRERISKAKAYIVVRNYNAAIYELEKMRETVELVITQSKEIGKITARSADAMMMLEEASASRSMIARDTYDAKRWRDEVADTREAMANSRSVVLSAVNDPNAPPAGELVAENKPIP